MKFLNFGSLNIDFVYSVHHAARPGETVLSEKLEKFCGGKGLNQSVALKRAGAEVFHAGAVGQDGGILLEMLKSNGVDTGFVKSLPGPSGHAVIQVDESGQNCILLYGGSNQQVEREHIDRVVREFSEGDTLVLQNEISNIGYIIDRAHARGMTIVLNPSPINRDLLEYPLEKVTLFAVNEIEGYELSGEKQPEKICGELIRKYPGSSVLLTLGCGGAVYSDGKTFARHGIFKVDVADTTAAGDTFLGYFLACCRQTGAKEALRIASAASALAVSVPGAASSIPAREDVLNALKRFSGQ